MTDVEQKVVQMRFDDKEFDEKARKTMKTLDELNARLSFDAVAQKSDAAFKEITDNVEKIADKAYTIIDRVIDKIKDNIANNIFSFINDTLVGQVTTGWQKYADMTKAVGTLAARGYGMERISDVLERLAFFSDETSYNFNTMLENIGRFVSSGVELEDAEQALEGIAGLAGVTGVNAETASRAMYQMSQAMGSFMKAQDWMSISTANLDTVEFKQNLIDTAVALGTLKKAGKNTYVSLRATNKKGAQAFNAEQGFVESLTNGAWVTRDVMVETYKKYASIVDKVHQEVQASNGTLYAADVLSDMKRDNEILIKQYMKMFNVTEDIAIEELDKINSVKKATEEEIQQYMKLKKVSHQVAEATLNADYNNMLKDWQKRTKKTLAETEAMLTQFNGWTDSLGLKAFTNSQEARTFEDVINSVKEAVSSNWRSIYTSIFGDYQEAKALWSDMADGLIDLFAGRIGQIANMFKEWKNEGGRETLWRGLYAFGSGTSMFVEEIRQAWDDLISDGESGVSVLTRISNKIQEAGFKFYIFMEHLRDNNFFKDLAEAFHNIKAFIDQVFGAFYDGVRDAIPSGGFFLNLLLEFASILKEVTSNFKLSDEAVDGLRRTFKGLTILLLKGKKTFVQVLVKIVLPVLNAVFAVLGNIVEVVVTITGTLGDILEYFMPLDSETSGLVTILEVLTDVLTTIIKLVGQGLTWVLKKIVPIIGVAIGAVTSLISGIGDLFSAKSIKMGGGSKLVKGFDGLKDKILEAWAPLKSFSETIDEYKNGKGLVNFLNLFTDITDGIGNRLLLTLDATVGFLEVMSESKFGKALGYAIKALRWVIRAGLWLFNNLFLPIIREIILELGMTIESIKGIIDERGILGLLDLIQEVFKTGIFGSLVNTINLINSLIGSNGIGRLFSKGAKALESIADYFNAAKMNQAADVLLKIIAAVTLLYTLLALITFLPVDRYDQMQKALLDFALALGIVVGGVFVISAAAALAGGNLIAMAAGFIGVAVAITTALWALNAMVEWLDRVNTDVIDAGLEKLMDILTAYSWFIVKTVGPLTLVGAKWEGDIGGVGIAMAGLAASIWILMKALEHIDNVNVSDLNTLFEFLSGIYAVLAASTALMVLAAQGQTVHGISIAIASVGVAFAAVKMIFPLCKDIIAEQDVFIEGQAALATFGLFMLAFAASMWLVTSGVHGILSSLASILMFRAFISIMVNTLLPAIETLIDAVITIAGKLNDFNFMGELNWVAMAVAAAGIFGLMWFVATQWRYILGYWSDMDTVSIIAVSAAIVGSFAIITYSLIPAIKQLNQALKANTVEQTITLLTTLLLIFSPLYAIMIGFTYMMHKYADLYGETKSASYNLNIGLMTRNYNAVASMFQSIMWTVLGVMGFATVMLHMASKIKFAEQALPVLKTVLIGTGAIVLTILIPLMIFFGEVMSQLDSRMKAGRINMNTSWGAGLVKKSEDSIVAIVRALSNVISIVATLLPGIMLAFGFLAQSVAEKGKTEEFEEMFMTVSGMIIGIMATVALITTAIMQSFHGSNAQMMSQIQNTAFYSSAAAAAKQVSAIVGCIALVFGAMGAVAIISGFMNKDEYDRFKETLKWSGLIVVGIMAALYLFANKMNASFQSHSFILDSSDSQTPLKAVTPMLNLLVAVIGVTSILISLGAVLIPAIGKLQAMDLDKMTAAFTGTIVLVLGSIIAFIAVMALNQKQSDVSVGKSIFNLIKTLLLIVVPFIALSSFMENVADAFATLGKLSKDKIEDVKWIFLLFTLIGALVVAIGFIAGNTPQVMAGIAIVAGAFVAIGFAAYLIGQAADLLVGAYAKWMKVVSVQAYMSQAAKNAKDVTEALGTTVEAAYDTGDKIGTSLKQGAYDAVGAASPAKDFEKLGKFCDQGLARGINRNTRDVAKASEGLAKITESVFEDDLEIASPSKVFYKNGRFIVAGLEEGVNSKKSSMADTMSELSDTIANSINSGFDNIDINIFGDKTLEDYIHEFTDGLDAGSILGKALGLDEDLHLTTWAEIENLDYVKRMGGQVPEWFESGKWTTDASDNNTASKIGKKISNIFNSTTIKDTLHKIGVDLGLSTEEGVEKSGFMDKVKNWIMGEDGTGKTGAIGTIMTAIESGDWTTVGTSIGTGIGSGLIAALSPFVTVGKRLIHAISGEYDMSDYINKSKVGEDTYWTLRKEYDENDVHLVEGTRFRFVGNSVDTSKLYQALNEDMENRMKELLQNISKPVLDADTGIFTYYINRADVEAINQLLKDWDIASPSKVMKYAVSQIGEGWIVGWDAEEPKIVKTLEDANSEQYKVLSMGMEALDQLGSDPSVIQPRIVPVLDTSGVGTNIGELTPFFSGDTNAKISASLDYSGSMSFLAAGQAAIVSAVDAMRKDLINSLSLGELVKVDVNSTVNDNNLFDHFVEIERQEYNRTGAHAW